MTMTYAGQDHPVKAMHDLLREPVAMRSCSAASVKAMSDKRVVFNDLLAGLRVTQRELDSARGWDDMLNAGFLFLRWTKASCDAFLAMSAAALGPQNKAAQAILHGYRMAATLADAGGRMASGQAIDGALVFRDVKDAALGLAGDSLGPASGLVNVYANIAIDGFRGDRDGVLKGALLDQTVEQAKLMRDAMGESEGGAKMAGAVRGLDLVVSIATAATTFQRELEKAEDEYLDVKVELAERNRSMKKQMSTEAARLEQRIRRLSQEIDSCFVVAPRSDA